MLATAVRAQIKYEVEHDKRVGLSGSIISRCPMSIYIDFHGLDPQQRLGNFLVLEDGHRQEEAMLGRLRRAGFSIQHTGEDQLTVFIGKAKIPGHPDGFISSSNLAPSMLELKGMNNRRFRFFEEEGLEAGIEAQVQSYLSPRPLGVETCWVYATRKETADPSCRFVERDAEYSREVIGNLDEVVLGDWKPEPVMSFYCEVCKHKEYCWGGSPIVDFSKVCREEEAQELVEQWIIGKMRKNSGEVLYEEARNRLGKLLRSGEDQWIADAFIGEEGKGGRAVQVKVARQSKMERRFDSNKFVEHFGASNLPLVMRERESEIITTREVNW